VQSLLEYKGLVQRSICESCDHTRAEREAELTTNHCQISSHACEKIDQSGFTSSPAYFPAWISKPHCVTCKQNCMSSAAKFFEIILLEKIFRGYKTIVSNTVLFSETQFIQI
jgi:hypothetical protein